MAAIKAKHQAALAVTEPTATAQAAAARDADAKQAADAAPESAGATPAAAGVQETPERPADQLTPDRPGVVLMNWMHVYLCIICCTPGQNTMLLHFVPATMTLLWMTGAHAVVATRRGGGRGHAAGGVPCRLACRRADQCADDTAALEQVIGCDLAGTLPSPSAVTQDVSALRGHSGVCGVQHACVHRIRKLCLVRSLGRPPSS